MNKLKLTAPLALIAAILSVPTNAAPNMQLAAKSVGMQNTHHSQLCRAHADQ